MTTCLAVTTSTERGSVALLRDDEVLARHEYLAQPGHAEHLIAAIDVCLVHAGVDRASIDRLACDVGPGTFTGVRVGVATIQGISLALLRPAVGVVSLEAMVLATGETGRMMPILDAKKGEVYFAVYEGTRTLVEPSHIARSARDEILAIVREHGATPFGEGAELLELADARFAGCRVPDASWIARSVSRSTRDLAPLYVRAPDARPLFAPMV